MSAGALCYYLGSLANFYALTIIDANIERPLLFSYPIFVVLITTLISRRAPPPRIVFALIVTSLGVLLVTDALNDPLKKEEWSGMGWTVFCSFTIAIYFLISEKLTKRLGTGLFTFIAMSAAALCFAGHYQVLHGWPEVSLARESWIILGGLVTVSTVLPLFLMAEGVRRVGAARAALISTIGPPATAIMAYHIIDETLSLTQILGVGMVIIGVLALEIVKTRKL